MVCVGIDVADESGMHSKLGLGYVGEYASVPERTA